MPYTSVHKKKNLYVIHVIFFVHELYVYGSASFFFERLCLVVAWVHVCVCACVC